MYLSHGPGEHTPTTPAFAPLVVVCKSTKGLTMLELIVKKAGLHVNDVAVRFGCLAHPLDFSFRTALFPVLRELEMSSAILEVQRAAYEAADPLECQDCFRAHGRDDIPVQLRRHLVVELSPVLELRHFPQIFNPHACNVPGEILATARGCAFGSSRCAAAPSVRS